MTATINQLPNQREQPKQKKSSQPKINSFFSKLNILFKKVTYFLRKQNIVNHKFFKKQNFVLQNVSYLGGLILAIIAIWISVRSYNNANIQFRENAEKSDSLFDVQLKNERLINANLEKIRKQSDSLYKIQFELTNTQISIIDKLLKDQINSGSPKIIVVSETLEDKNTLIEGRYVPVIEIVFRNTGIRYGWDIMFRAFTVTNDFKSIWREIGYSGSTTFLGPGQENNIKFMPKFDKPITNFYFCFEISYVDKLTNQKTYNTFFTLLQNIRGDDEFVNCKNHIANKLRKLINDALVREHQDTLHE